MDLTGIYNLIFWVSITSVLIPLACCIIKLKTLNRTLRVLFIYIVISASTEIVSRQLSTINLNGYYAVQNIFTLLECALLTFIYYLEFRAGFSRTIILLAFLIYGIIACTELFFIKSIFQPNNVISSVESCLLIGLSVSFFYKVHTELAIPKLREYYFFWLNTAVLIYFSTSIILFLFDGYLEKCPIKIFYLLYSLHLLTNITYNILLSTGIWSSKQK